MAEGWGHRSPDAELDVHAEQVEKTPKKGDAKPKKPASGACPQQAEPGAESPAKQSRKRKGGSGTGQGELTI